jgi:hypothetical protein
MAASSRPVRIIVGPLLEFAFAGPAPHAEGDLETAFATLSQQSVGPVLVGISTFFNRRTEQLAALATRHALPAIYPFRPPTWLVVMAPAARKCDRGRE